jgi:hypothetical protein
MSFSRSIKTFLKPDLNTFVADACDIYIYIYIYIYNLNCSNNSNTQNHWIYGFFPSSGILNMHITMIREMDLFPSSGEKKISAARVFTQPQLAPVSYREADVSVDCGSHIRCEVRYHHGRHWLDTQDLSAENKR